MHNYKKLDVWNRAVEFATQIYSMTKNFPKEEFRQFLNISFGSCSEIETQLIISYKLGYLSEDDFTFLSNKVVEIQKIIYKLIQKFS